MSITQTAKGPMRATRGTKVKEVAKGTLQSLVTWDWTKQLLHWLILSAGTMSECAFLIASLWMSVNSSVHALVLLAMPEQTTRHLSEMATAAYVALPECILPLASVVVISHVRVWLYGRKDVSAGIWSALFGLPTLVFLVLSLITLGCSVASVSFLMPEPLIIVRALAGYMFAFVSLLYARLGVPQERDRLQQKDDVIASLRHQYEEKLAEWGREKEIIVAHWRQQNESSLLELRREKDAIIADLRRQNESNLAEWNRQNQLLQTTIEFQTREIASQKVLLTETKNAYRHLQNELDKSEETALQVYSHECLRWLKSGIKTVSVEEITRFTGHSKRKIEHAITKGSLQTAPRNRELVLVSSLVIWLKQNPPGPLKMERETSPSLQAVAG